MQYLERNFRKSNEPCDVSQNKPNDGRAEAESLEATLLQLVRKKRRRKIERIIDESGPRILRDCDTALLLRSARKHRCSRLFAFVLESKPKTDAEVPDLTSITASALVEDWPTVRQLYHAHVDAVVFRLHGQRQWERRTFDDEADEIEWSEKSWSRAVVLARILSELLKSGLTRERVVEVLRELHCDLDLIVGLGDAELTKAHLLAARQPPFRSEYHCESTCRVLVNNVDVPQLRVFLDYSRAYSSQPTMVALELFRLLLDHYMRDLHATEVGRTFAKTLLLYDFFDDDFLQCFERAIMRVSRENLEAFLEYEFRSAWRSKLEGRDVLASAFGNRDPEVLRLLEKCKVDVDARGYRGSTPLHFAAAHRAVESVEYLLGRGADPNVTDDFGARPLHCVHGRPDDKKADEACVRLLLIGGADPLLVHRSSKEGQIPQFFGVYPRHSRDYRRIVGYMLAELAIREALGRPVEAPIDDCRSVMGRKYTDDFYEGCRRQIDELKSRRIRDDFTMFSLLSCRKNRAVRWIGEDDRRAIAAFMRTYESDAAIMPYYRDALTYRIKVIDRMSIYVDTTKEILSECMRLADADHLVIRTILNYLTLKDIP